MPTIKFKKGDPKPPNSGRKKGVKNKLTIDVQQTAFEIFEKLGGIEGACKYFESSKQAKGQFYNIFYKMLPSNVDVKHGGEIEHTVFMMPRPKKKNENAD